MFPHLSITDLTHIILQGINLIEHLNARRNSTYELQERIPRIHVSLIAKPVAAGRRAFSGKEYWQEDLGECVSLSPFSISLYLHEPLGGPSSTMTFTAALAQQLYADYKSHNGYKRIFLSCYPLPKWNLQLGFL